MLSWNVICEHTVVLSLSVILCLATSLSHHYDTKSELFYKAFGLASTIFTFRPATLLPTIAMPVPIWPAPIIPIVLIGL